MGRDIRIEEVDNGFIIRCWKKTDGELYGGESTETVASSKAEVKDYIDQWLNGEAPPFKKD